MLLTPSRVSWPLQPGHDGSAEWNAYWDPLALGPVWASRVPLVLVPLDATNQVPVTPELLYRWAMGVDRA